MILLGRLVGLGGWSLRLSDLDLHWCSVSLLGEAGEDAWAKDDGLAILWSYAQRMWEIRDKPLRRKDGLVLRQPYSLADYVQAYSQPVNPYWTNHGTPGQIERRIRYRAMALSDVPRMLVDLVNRWCVGAIPPEQKYLGAVHFIASGAVGTVSDDLRPVHIGGTSHRNAFLSDPESRGWHRFPVVVAPPASSDMIDSVSIRAWHL